MEVQAPTLIQSESSEEWLSFLERLSDFDARLITELETCWLDLRATLEGQLQRLDAFSIPDLNQPGVEVFQKAREEISEQFLLEPLARWERKRPYKRALKAIETYDKSVDDLIGSLPQSVFASGRQALKLFGEQGATPLQRSAARLRRKQRALPLEALVADEMRKLSVSRLDTEGQYLLVLAEGVSRLRTVWEITRAALDASVKGEPLPSEDLTAWREELKHAVELLRQRAESALSAWRKRPEIIIERLSHRIFSKAAWGREVTHFDSDQARAAYVNHWVEQLRAIENEIRLEPDLQNSEDRILGSFRRGLESLYQERASLLAELDEVIAWLREQIRTGVQEAFPPPQFDLVPALSQLSELEDSLKDHLAALPESCQTPAKLSASPRRTKWRTLHPRETFYKAFVRAGRQDASLALKEVESEHRKIVQQIERAREVVAFAQESSDHEQDSDRQVKQESLQNALSLLEFHRNQSQDWRAAIDSRLARMLATVFIESRLLLSRDRLGVFAHLARQGTRRAIMQVSRNFVALSTKAFHNLPGAIEKLALRFLVYIGWKPAPQAGKMEVITRPSLPREFVIDLATKELPAIYRRLFRFEAVQDPMFLVGREREMTAIAQARTFWEAGRPASIIVVGERGSGKTSLINCALKRSLEGLEIIRGEFKQRLLNESQLRGFVAEMVGSSDTASLESFLAERRRVLIIEEMERTFLRQVGYYPVIRALQRLISATCSSTLWILAINQVAFRFLNASVNLGDSFSHRINAASAGRDDLRQAILLRHNLSGLRLQFASPPQPRNLIGKLESRLQSQINPEAIFFDALAEESTGIFRTAFDIWLSHIDTVEAGVLYMKYLATPNLSSVIEALGLAHLFTLVAILQHGSLTADEHATVFQKSAASSRAQIDELLAREIIEQDPGRPGFRVRPEAMRVVKEALYRRNLL